MALGNTLVFTLGPGLLIVILNRRLELFLSDLVLRPALRAVLCTGLMTAFLNFFLVEAWWLAFSGIAVLLCTAAGAAGYFACAYFLKLPENGAPAELLPRTPLRQENK